MEAYFFADRFTPHFYAEGRMHRQWTGGNTTSSVAPGRNWLCWEKWEAFHIVSVTECSPLFVEGRLTAQHCPACYVIRLYDSVWTILLLEMNKKKCRPTRRLLRTKAFQGEKQTWRTCVCSRTKKNGDSDVSFGAPSLRISFVES